VAGPGEPAKEYVQVGMMVTAQPAGIANHRGRPAIGGTTVGVAAAGGFWVTRTLAVGAGLRWRPASVRRLELFGGGGLAVSTFVERRPRDPTWHRVRRELDRV
jgi:hypothetical protein